jgi:hypothetical protein
MTILEQLNALDPIERPGFIAANRTAIMAAVRKAAPPGRFNPEVHWPWLGKIWKEHRGRGGTPEGPVLGGFERAPFVRCLSELPLKDRPAFFRLHETEIRKELRLGGHP